MFKARVLTPILFVLLASAGHAQQSGTLPDASNGDIRLNVDVTDGSGKPVRGLSPADFTLVSSKTPVKIGSLTEIDGNHPAEVLIVIDAVNTPFSAVTYQRDQVVKFLRMHDGMLQRPTSLAVLSDKGIGTSGDPTTNGNALADALAKNETGLRIIGRSQGFYGAQDRASLSLAALRQILASEAKLPGRKLVLWISPGWPILAGPRLELSSKQQQALFQDAVKLSTEMRTAQITLFNINSWGPGESLVRATYYESFLAGAKKPSDITLGSLSLQVLATQSGGLVTNSSDVAGALQHAIDDVDDYYQIEFEPVPAERAVEYHPLQIEVAKSGLKARSTQGYYAQP
jgi:VWFA-related protein